MTRQKRVLILAGTTEATELATRAAALSEVEVIISLAGRTRQPVVSAQHNLAHNRQLGGFGGIAGLTSYLQEQNIAVLIDATHPFAAQISWNATAAAMKAAIPHLMLVRPEWEKTKEDHWINAVSNEAAAMILPKLAQRVFLTIGRQELPTFAHLRDLWFLMRMIDPPSPNVLTPPGKLLLERGPFSLEQERSLLHQYKVEAIVSKNSGGDATYAKIIAARELEIPVVMVQRPPMPEGEKVSDVETALLWLRNKLSN